MKINPAECIKNMCECTGGTYMLFREFGLNNVDSMGIRKADVKRAISEYYPDLEDVKVTKTGDSYKVEVSN